MVAALGATGVMVIVTVVEAAKNCDGLARVDPACETVTTQVPTAMRCTRPVVEFTEQKEVSVVEKVKALPELAVALKVKSEESTGLVIVEDVGEFNVMV
jgi:hypothetical protein